jgi:uncharacterized membrane protein YjjB (DUF3815 family)
MRVLMILKSVKSSSKISSKFLPTTICATVVAGLIALVPSVTGLGNGFIAV